MQRQSLGSPGSKLHIYGGEESFFSDEEIKPRRSSLSPTPPLTSTPKSEKLIHLIPVLTLICFLILYLNSHSPSQSDFAQFDVLKHSSKHLDSTESEISHVDQFIDSRRADALEIRSLKNLQEVDNNVSKSRPHRKIADF